METFWREDPELDDLDPMSDPEERLDNHEIDAFEEAFMRGYAEAV